MCKKKERKTLAAVEWGEGKGKVDTVCKVDTVYTFLVCFFVTQRLEPALPREEDDKPAESF